MLKRYFNRRTARALGSLLLAAVVLGPGFLAAHPDIEIRIEVVTKKIQQDPANAKLYGRRGELHREHRDWESAIADYSRAAELDPNLATVHLARGMLYFDTDRLAEAKTELDVFLAEKPNHSHGLATRARVLVELGRLLEAADDFDLAVTHSSRPTPGLYLERARALANAGEQNVGRAITGLDDGMEKLGRIVTLQSFAIELEVRAGRYDAALERLDQISKWLPNERFLRRQGDVLRAAGRTNEAQQAYLQAAGHIDTLPFQRRLARPMTELQGELKAALAEIEASTNPSRVRQAPALQSTSARTRLPPAN